MQVYHALSTHKSQEMTIREGQQFKEVVVYLPESGKNTCPGLKLVGAFAQFVTNLIPGYQVTKQLPTNLEAKF
jgi:hypothetical protein